MKRLLHAALAATAIGMTGGIAQAATVVDFELNGSLANAGSGPATITNNGAVLGADGITFGLNHGPVISGLGALPAYTIDMGFTLDRLVGTTGTGFVKLIDFSGLTADRGLYSSSGRLDPYPLTMSNDQVFAAGTPVRLTLSRDVAGLITAYVNGSQFYTQSDPTNRSGTAIDGLNPLTFFTDDPFESGSEATSGFVDYIRIADTAITPAEILPATPAVPEPATWGLMITGLGLVGAALRSRSRLASAYAC